MRKQKPYTPTVNFTDDGDLKTVTRAWGAENGLHGRQGGWIYTDSGHTVTQGWWFIWNANRRQILDWLTRRETAFDRFEQMVAETGPTYTPTIYLTNAFTRMLAAEYNAAQVKRGDPRRAHTRYLKHGKLAENNS